MSNHPSPRTFFARYARQTRIRRGLDRARVELTLGFVPGRLEEIETEVGAEATVTEFVQVCTLLSLAPADALGFVQGRLVFNRAAGDDDEGLGDVVKSDSLPNWSVLSSARSIDHAVDEWLRKANEPAREEGLGSAETERAWAATYRLSADAGFLSAAGVKTANGWYHALVCNVRTEPENVETLLSRMKTRAP